MNDYSLTKDLIEKGFSTGNSLSIVLIVLVSLNIGIESFRFISMIIISNKEKHNKRQILIEEKRLKIIEQLFQSLDKLTLFDKSESSILLDNLKDINLFITKNKLYISKNYLDCTNEILDYFKDVLADYRKKNVEKEISLFDKFCHEFNK